MTSIVDLLGAEDEIYSVLHTVLTDPVPDFLAQAPKVFYQGVAEEDSTNQPPIDDIWLRASYRMDEAEQSTLSEQGHAKRWLRHGTLFIQFFNPLRDPSSLKTNKRLAILAQRAYESAGSQTGMIFRDVRVTPIGPSESWYQVNLVARFEYEEFH